MILSIFWCTNNRIILILPPQLLQIKTKATFFDDPALLVSSLDYYDYYNVLTYIFRTKNTRIIFIIQSLC